MTDPVRPRGEVHATIIREGIAHGFLEPQLPLRTTLKFKQLFGGLLSCLGTSVVQKYADTVLQAHPETETDHREFMDAFVIEYDETPGGPAAAELLLDSAGDIPETHFVSLRTILGLAAFTIHRDRYPVQP